MFSPSSLQALQTGSDLHGEMCPTPMRAATRIPNWALATAFAGISAGTYFYVLQKVGPHLDQDLAAEAARQEAAERRAGAK